MTNADAVKWLENLKKDIGNPVHQSLWHYEQVLTEIIKMLDGNDELQEEHISCLMMVQGIDCENCPRRFTCHEPLTIEPNNSDEPQERSCDNCNHKHCFACMAHRYYHYYYEPKDEVIGDNLSPFDKGINVRSKNEL